MYFLYIIFILCDVYNVKMYFFLILFVLIKVLKIKKYNNYCKYFIDGLCDSFEFE